MDCRSDLLFQGALGFWRRRRGRCGLRRCLLRCLPARFGVRFARCHHLGQPGEDLRHAVLEVLVIGITRRVHELHVAHLELHVHARWRFARGPAGGAPHRGWGLATVRAHGARATRTLRTGRGRSWACCRRAFLQAGVRRWRGGVWREERLRPARRQVAAVRQPVGAGVAVLRARARRLEPDREGEK